MKCEQIFEELEKKSVLIEKFWNRKLVTVKKEDFKKYEKHFTKPIKIGSKINYRTKGNFKHIHAIKNEKYVQFHFDYGNPYKSVLFNIPHFFIDVIPYFSWFFITLKVPYKMKE